MRRGELLALVILLIIQQIQAKLRNLQFSHFVQGYLFDFPPEWGLFVDSTGNILDPYLPSQPISSSVGNGKSGDFNIRVQCDPPLTLKAGVCACPDFGRYVESLNICLTSSGVITAPGVSPTDSPNYNLNDPSCPLQIVRENLYPNTIASLGSFFREYDGRKNNQGNPQWGSTNSLLERKTNWYSDSLKEPQLNLPNPREVSNSLGSPASYLPFNNRLGLSMAFVIFGQFLDHDLDLTEAQHPSSNFVPEYYNIKIPKNDNFFINIPEIQFTRSQYSKKSSRVRNFQNMITTWIDSSQVYGSDPLTNCILRQFKNGKLKTSRDNLLPIIQQNFRAGDIRAIQNVVLASYHTIFMREHNRICDRLKVEYPDLNDEELFQSARNFVIGLEQKIVFKDFLPLLLGNSYQTYISSYKGYNPSINPSLPLQFSTAAFRVGHSLLAPEFALVNDYQQKYGSFSLDQLFFASHHITSQNIDDLFRGLPQTPMKQKNSQIINQVRNLLVLDPQRRQVKLDLFALNLQRGRDHGVGSYNEVRKKYGLYPLVDFYELLPNTIQGKQFARKLTDLYGSPQRLDLWVGIISQKPVDNGVLGELGSRLVGEAFRNIRDGDRFWYENQSYYSREVQREIENTSLSQIIMRNTKIRNLPPNIFKAN